MNIKFINCWTKTNHSLFDFWITFFEVGRYSSYKKIDTFYVTLFNFNVLIEL